jgi:uncharacterized protein YecE (DUF72 family)
MKRRERFYIGTSGWYYKHWVGTFYPADINAAGQFPCYQRYFNTVEINNSFYQLPSARTFITWRKESTDAFVFSVKASRFITHMKKLKMTKAELRPFLTRLDKLKEKLGPILFQLPPQWHCNAERLERFLSRLPEKHRYAFEFRDHTWYNEDVYAILKKARAAFCIYELEREVSPLAVTADFVYVRLHGPDGKYQGSYSDTVLKKWARQIRRWTKDKKEVYVYFDNDQKAHAAQNAIRLIQLLHKTK